MEKEVILLKQKKDKTVNFKVQIKSLIYVVVYDKDLSHSLVDYSFAQINR